MPCLPLVSATGKVQEPYTLPEEGFGVGTVAHESLVTHGSVEEWVEVANASARPVYQAAPQT